MWLHQSRMKTHTSGLENLGPYVSLQKQLEKAQCLPCCYLLPNNTHTHTHANVEHLKTVQFPKVSPAQTLYLLQLSAE